MDKHYGAIKAQAKITDEVLVSFSGGKDSIVVLDLCCKYFKKVKPFFMYLVKDLEFQERTLRWYENRYGLEILRIPHFEMSNFLRCGSFTDVHSDVNIVGIQDVYEYVRQESGIHWISAGERMSDSLVRGAMIKNSSSIDKKRGRFYPIAYWKKADVLKYIKIKKLYISKEQERLGFSFRSLDGREMSIVKEMYPDDYKKIEKVFPFVGAGVEHYERYRKEQVSKV